MTNSIKVASTRGSFYLTTANQESTKFSITHQGGNNTCLHIANLQLHICLCFMLAQRGRLKIRAARFDAMAAGSGGINGGDCRGGPPTFEKGPAALLKSRSQWSSILRVTSRRVSAALSILCPHFRVVSGLWYSVKFVTSFFSFFFTRKGNQLSRPQVLIGFVTAASSFTSSFFWPMIVCYWCLPEIYRCGRSVISVTLENYYLYFVSAPWKWLHIVNNRTRSTKLSTPRSTVNTNFLLLRPQSTPSSWKTL